MKKIILIIDPFQKEPATDALNTLSELSSRLISEKRLINTYLEFYFPLQGKKSLSEYLRKIQKENKSLLCVISLGSYTNITDKAEWVENLGIELKKYIIEQYIPFLGICFSHQLLCHIYNSNINFILNRDLLPEKKFNEFRKIDIIHPTLSKILNGKKSFISMAKHEQEVTEISHESLEIICSSSACKVEGVMHKIYPAFSFQSHPEEFHESGDGFYLLESFLRFFLEKT